MGLEAMAAAAEVAALADKERKRTFTLSPSHNSNPQRSGSTLSDSTVGDNEASESDSSGQFMPPIRTPPLKKRRSSETPSKQRKQNMSSKMSAEVDNFPAEMLLDLAGSTSAEVRRMNEDERALVHYKRRLRNRESAKRSRARRQATISDIQTELEDLRQLTTNLVDRCMDFAKVNEKQALELETLRKEKVLLESLLRGNTHSV